ncbi:MAG: hypothetical protein ACLFSV_04140 [Alkalispirochaeta sp.]
MKEHAIGSVVCRAPDEQVAAESPEEGILSELCFFVEPGGTLVPAEAVPTAGKHDRRLESASTKGVAEAKVDLRVHILEVTPSGRHPPIRSGPLGGAVSSAERTFDYRDRK